jgi:hypothetical protein
MKYYGFNATEAQLERLRGISRWADMSVSEFLRRLLDWGTQEYYLNELLPHLSGQVPEQWNRS